MANEAAAIAQLVTIMWISLGVVIEFFIIMMAYLFFNMYRKAWFLSKITKKAYGVVEIAGKGGQITRHIANFYDDYATVRNGVYFLDPNKVYWKEGARVLHYDENDAFEALSLSQPSLLDNEIKLSPAVLKKLSPSQQHALMPIVKEGGEVIARVYLDPVKMTVGDKGKDRSRYDPAMIKQIFLKQKAIAENEAWSKFVQQIKVLLLIAVAGAVAAAAVSYMNYDKLKVLAGVG